MARRLKRLKGILTPLSFEGYLLSHLCVLFVPVVLLAVILNVNFRKMETDLYAQHAAAVKTVQRTLDDRLIELSDFAEQLYGNPHVRFLLNSTKPFTVEDRYATALVIQEFGSLRAYKGFMSDFYLYFLRSDTITTPQAQYGAGFFHQFVYCSESMDFDSWHDAFLLAYHRAKLVPADLILTENSRAEYVTFLQSLPRGDQSLFLGTFAALIRADVLRNALADEYGGIDSCTYIVDGQGKVIVRSGDDSMKALPPEELRRIPATGTLAMDGRRMIVSQRRSLKADLTYVRISRQEVYLSRANETRDLMTILSIILALPTFAVAGYMAYRNYAPVRRLVQAIAIPGEPRESGRRKRIREFGALMEFVRMSLENRARDQRMLPSLRSHFIRRILEGDGTVLRDAGMYEQAFGIRFQGDRFVVLIVEFGKEIRDGAPHRMPSPEEVQAFIDAFRGKRAVPANEYHVVHRGPRSCSILCNGIGSDEGRDHREEVADMEHSLLHDLAEVNNCQMTIGRSLPCIGLDRIKDGYLQALSAAEQRIVKGWGVVVPFTEDLSRHGGEPFSYDIETEKAVIASVRSGDQAQLDRLLLNLNRDLERRPLTKDVAQCLLYDLISTALKCIQEMRSDPLKTFSEDINLVDFLLETDTLEEAFRKARQVFTLLCDRSLRAKRSHNDSLKDSLVSYLNENFTDPKLCLKTVSQRFSISPGYLSRFFKEQTGENFIDTLHRLRLEHTVLLLCRRDGRKIKDISREAGFGNDTAMIRLFKKEFGESPSDYRDRL